MAPEVLSKNKYSEKADVFSFAIVLWELMTGLRPYSHGEFASMNQAQLMYSILEKQARPPLEGLSSGLQELISDCWSVNARLRPSFAEIVVRLRRLKSKAPNSSIPVGSHGSLQEYDESRDGSSESSSFVF